VQDQTPDSNTIYTNQDLFNNHKKRQDHIFIVTSSPIQTNNGYSIQINFEQAATVLHKYAPRYNQPYTVEEIRQGITYSDCWLLSGGVFITDHRKRLAIGLRDGNGPDPFMFTNIGSGRCDGDLTTLCFRELAEELILCIREKNRWFQVCLLPNYPSPSLKMLRQMNHNITFWRNDVITTETLKPLKETKGIIQASHHKKNISTLLINWINKKGTTQYVEELQGYIYIDQQHNTVEFRLTRTLNLDAYRDEDTAIFFAEGTGYAKWSTVEELHQLATTGMATPMLENFTKFI